MSRQTLAPTFRRLRHLPTAFAFGALLGACASSQPSFPAGASPAPPNMTFTAGNIGAVVRTYDVAEIKAANLALQKSQNASVRTFAQRIISDDSASEQQLSAVLSQLGTKPTPNTVSQQRLARDSTAVASFQNKSGADFDRAYIDTMIEGQRALIRDIDTMLPGTRDQAMQSYLTSRRATATTHLHLAEQVRSTLG